MNIVDRINAVRSARGLSALASNEQLAAAARRHAADLARNPWITYGDSHIGSDGSSAGERVSQAGYRGEKVREITGWGWGNWDEEAQIAYWSGSPSHERILFDETLNEAGEAFQLAIAPSEWARYWVVCFGRGAGAPDGGFQDGNGHSVQLPVVIGGGVGAQTLVDLLDYLAGDGRTYRVGNSRGSFEVFQTQRESDRFYQVKAWDDLSVVNYEEFSVDHFIRRDVDTSPGGGRFYRQFDAPWAPRFMRVGESFSQRKRVQFYWLADCSESEANSDEVTDTITLDARYDRYTFRSNGWAAVTLPDVVQLRWVEGGEIYFFARRYGLVGWERLHQDLLTPAWSAISEMREGVGVLERLRIGCLGQEKSRLVGRLV